MNWRAESNDKSVPLSRPATQWAEIMAKVDPAHPDFGCAAALQRAAAIRVLAGMPRPIGSHFQHQLLSPFHLRSASELFEWCLITRPSKARSGPRQTWCRSEVLRGILMDIANELREHGVLDEEECLFDATFVMAKGGGAEVGRLSLQKA
jgi:hypothetical protein